MIRASLFLVALAPWLPVAGGSDPLDARGGAGSVEIQEPAESEGDRQRKLDAWQALPEEERQRVLDGYKRFREYPDAYREELKRRWDAVDHQVALVERRLTPEERARLEAMPPHERREFFHGRVRHSFERVQEMLREKYPEDAARIEQLPEEERSAAAREVIERHRRSRALEKADKLTSQGWMGAETRLWLEAASMEQIMPAVYEAERWRKLSQAKDDGTWERLGLDSHEEKMLSDVPARDFHRSFELLVQGAPKSEVFRRMRDRGHRGWGGGRDGEGRRGDRYRDGQGGRAVDGPESRDGQPGREGRGPREGRDGPGGRRGMRPGPDGPFPGEGMPPREGRPPRDGKPPREGTPPREGERRPRRFER